MRDLEIATEWMAGDGDDPIAHATFGALEITAGPEHTPLTEVEDTIARTVRRQIYVPANLLAEWLIVHWWRLRWEGPRPRASADWRRAHSMASIGHGYAWPTVEFSSDGEFVQIKAVAETAPDVAAVRYLRGANVSVRAVEFEAAVERFLDSVEGRIVACLPGEAGFSRLRAELREERERSGVARQCRWQARAGIDPGAAPDGWLEEAEDLASTAGTAASEEIFAALPGLAGLDGARSAIEAMRASSTTIDLRAVGEAGSSRVEGELPWQWGVRAATKLRTKLSIGRGRLDNSQLEQLLSVSLPLTGELTHSALSGGFRNGVANGRTAVLIPSRRIETQRFYLGRLLGCALAQAADQHVLAVTSEETALQKFERAFAQEFLCPWSDLDAFTSEHGLDDEALVDAAEHFQVSEWLVRTTLVNRGKLSREGLPAPA